MPTKQSVARAPLTETSEVPVEGARASTGLGAGQPEGNLPPADRLSLRFYIETVFHIVSTMPFQETLASGFSLMGGPTNVC